MGSNAPAFAQWLDQFFDDFYRRNPVDATFAGIHSFDDRLPDTSPGGIAAALDEIAQLQAALQALPDEPLTEAQRHDRRLAEGFLTIRAWEYRSRHFQGGNPAYYTGEAIFSILALFHRDSEPLADRVTAAIARMEAIPAFLQQGRENISIAPVDWTERAIRESRSGIAYFRRGIDLLAAERGIDDPAFLRAARTAATAFEDHLEWMEAHLLKHPRADVAAGTEAFNQYLRLGHQLRADQDADWVKNYATSTLQQAKAELKERAAALDPDRSWQDHLKDLADLHPTVEDYYDAYARVWGEARAAALAADLVTWPDFPIRYEPFPPSDREAAEGLYYLFYRCPAPFGRLETHRYRVTPIEPDMEAAVQAAKLRATNDSVIKLNHVVHHGGLGHHVQNWNGFRTESRIGRVAGVDGASRIAMLCAGTLVEGWACYAVDLMDEIGYLTPLESLAEVQSRARMAARAIADVGIHTGEMSLDDAAAFYEQEAGMSAAAARGEAVKNSMFPGAAMMYLVGTDAIHDLRKRVQALEGDAFSLRQFHDRLLSYGAIPVSMIAESMLSGADA
jgi:hypothetical protein